MRKRAGLLVASLGLGVVLAGCEGGLSGSLRPLYTEKEVVFDPGLVGKWQWGSDTGGFSWTFVADEDNTYYTLTAEGRVETATTEELAPTEAEEPEVSLYEAHLVSLGMYTFLDTYPAPEEEDRKILKQYDYIGLHDQYLISRDGDELRVSVLDDEWLEERILEGDVLPRIAKIDTEYVLTGTTRELQKFFLCAAADPDAFTELVTFTRVPPKPPTPPRKPARTPSPAR